MELTSQVQTSQIEEFDTLMTLYEVQNGQNLVDLYDPDETKERSYGTLALF